MSRPGRSNDSMSSTAPQVPPPIRIPYFMPCRDVPPRPAVHDSYENYVETIPFDFPSPVHAADTCVLCDISLIEDEPFPTGDMCRCCTIIYRNFQVHHTPLPTCSMCDTECYYLHRLCGKALCKSCQYNFQSCPHCKTPL